MWGLKFKVLNKDSIYTQITSKCKVIDYLYPVDNYKKGNKVCILGIHHLEGEDKEISRFISELKKNKKTKEIEINGKEVITLIAEEESFYQLLFAAELYYTSPVIIKGNYEDWNVSSFNRKLLENIIKEIEKWKDKFPEFELKSLSKCKLDEVYFPKIRPHLPQKQKEAFDVALKKGYYSFPRKVNLGDLSKELKVSVATMHENLRKAESKLMPFFAK